MTSDDQIAVSNMLSQVLLAKTESQCTRNRRKQACSALMAIDEVQHRPVLTCPLFYFAKLAHQPLCVSMIDGDALEQRPRPTADWIWWSKSCAGAFMGNELQRGAGSL